MIPHPEARSRRAAFALSLVSIATSCGTSLANDPRPSDTVHAPNVADATSPIDPAELSRRPHCPWPLWETYKRHFLEPDGRVVDHFAKHSTSEGQAYALFHALVARDADAFARIHAWARDHLAGGDLGARLPAWKWVSDDGGKVADPNAASDADLFIAYTLVHAAARFDTPDYASVGGRLLAQIERREVKDLPHLGPMMLPGPVGFTHRLGHRLNPSYLPIPLLRWAARMTSHRPDSPWPKMIETTLRMAEESTPHRLYPDWVIWDHQTQRFVADDQAPPVSSYDAIRAYLWPALMPPDDPARGRLLARGTGLLTHTRRLGFTPERLPVWHELRDPLTPGPVGFDAVMATMARALGDLSTADSLMRRVAEKRRPDGLYGEPAFYYDHNLLLFALGFLEGRYAFRADGGLSLPEEGGPCTPR